MPAERDLNLIVAALLLPHATLPRHYHYMHLLCNIYVNSIIIQVPLEHVRVRCSSALPPESSLVFYNVCIILARINQRAALYRSDD